MMPLGVQGCEKARGLQGVRNRFNPVQILQKRSESQEENVQSKIYETKVEQMKQSDPKSWWKEVKRLSGARNSSPCSLLSYLDVDELESLPLSEVVDYINHALLEPLEEYRLTSVRKGLTSRISSCNRVGRLYETLPPQPCKSRGS